MIRYALADGVARITIDRPDVLNAIDAPAEAELMRLWDEIATDRQIRLVVLTGAGERAFCAGADMKGVSSTGVDYWMTPRPGGFGGIALNDRLDIPVIARVNGHALGGGFEMVLGCDLVVMSSRATLGLPEPRVGRLALDGGLALLPRRLPHVQAMGMLLTGRRIDAAEALRLGLVNEVAEPAGLDAAVDRWVDQVLACAPLSVRAVKQMARAGETMTARDVQRLRLPALVEALRSRDQDEGVAAFREKRKPVWQGR